jgi:hypothetical protein
MFVDRSSCEIAVSTECNFLVQDEFPHISNLVFILLLDVVSKCCRRPFSVEKYIHETVLAYLAAPDLPHCQLVSLSLQQSCLLAQRVLVQRNYLLVT